jgi:hypothetical protein
VLNCRWCKQTSGERTPLAGWRSHSAIADFAGQWSNFPFVPNSRKFVAAECGDQHAASVRSPESSANTFCRDWSPAWKALG